MKVIVAIDDLDQLYALEGTGAAVKVGLPLIVQGGQRCLDILANNGFTEVLFDCKFFDIPSVVYKAVRELEGWHHLIGITVHAKGGVEMMKAAKEAAGEVPVYGVTALTSNPLALNSYILELAAEANDAGLAGVIAPVKAVHSIKWAEAFLKVLCPGIRIGSIEGDDQQWKATPEEARKAGADAIIIGRPITQTADPRAAYLSLVGSLVG